MHNATGIEGRRSGIFQLSLVAALSLCLSAFEYTDSNKKNIVSAGEIIPKEEIIEIEQDLEIPLERPKVIEENQEENKSVKTPIIIPPDPIIVVSPNPNPNPNPVILPDPDGPIIIGEPTSPVTIIEPEEFLIVEDMPHMKAAAHIKDKVKRQQISDQLIYAELNSKIVYPPMAKEAGISGKVTLSFRINAEGHVDDVIILKRAHPELDAEAVRVIKLLPEFVPGMQRGKKVNVRYTFPITFTLK